MVDKKLIWLGVGIGTTVGAWVPTLWGASAFSASSVLLSGVGGIAGIILAYKLRV